MPIQELSPEQEAESLQRKTEFRDKFYKLCDEYNAEIMYMPQWVPKPDGTFGTVITTSVIDRKYMPVPPSPTNPEVVTPEVIKSE